MIVNDNFWKQTETPATATFVQCIALVQAEFDRVNNPYIKRQAYYAAKLPANEPYSVTLKRFLDLALASDLGDMTVKDHVTSKLLSLLPTDVMKEICVKNPTPSYDSVTEALKCREIVAHMCKSMVHGPTLSKEVKVLVSSPLPPYKQLLVGKLDLELLQLLPKNWPQSY